MILIKCNANSVYFFTGLLIFVVAIALNISSIQCHGLHFHRKTSNNTEVNVYFPTVIVVVTDTWPDGTICERSTSAGNVPETVLDIEYLLIIKNLNIQQSYFQFTLCYILFSDFKSYAQQVDRKNELNIIKWALNKTQYNVNPIGHPNGQSVNGLPSSVRKLLAYSRCPIAHVQ